MLTLTDKQWAYLTLRMTLGINMLMHGLTRMFTGIGEFAEKTSREFEDGLLPVGLSYVVLLFLPFLEFAIGALMVLGFKLRWALIAGGFTITLLTFGSTANQNWSAAGIQLPYAIAFFILLFTREHNRIALDKPASEKTLSPGPSALH